MARSSSAKLDRPAAVRACRPAPTMTRESLEALITQRSALCDDSPISSEGLLDPSDRIELVAHAREVTLENSDSTEEIRHCVESKQSAA